MNFIGKILSLSMIPAFLVYTLVSLSIPMTAHAEAYVTPFVPESAESLPVEDEVRPRPQEPQEAGGSGWWKWALGIAIVGGAAVVASDNGSGDNGGSSGSGSSTVTGSW